MPVKPLEILYCCPVCHEFTCCFGLSCTILPVRPSKPRNPAPSVLSPPRIGVSESHFRYIPTSMPGVSALPIMAWEPEYARHYGDASILALPACSHTRAITPRERLAMLISTACRPSASSRRLRLGILAFPEGSAGTRFNHIGSYPPYDGLVLLGDPFGSRCGTQRVSAIRQPEGIRIADSQVEFCPETASCPGTLNRKNRIKKSPAVIGGANCTHGVVGAITGY